MKKLIDGEKIEIYKHSKWEKDIIASQPSECVLQKVNPGAIFFFSQLYRSKVAGHSVLFLSEVELKENQV